MVGQIAAFLGVSAIVIVTPGPDTALTIRNSLLGGRRAGVFTAIGVSSGQATWTLATAAGIAALLAASEPAFLAVKLLGAAYLVWLGAHSLVAAIRGRSRRSLRTVEAWLARGPRRVPAGAAQQPREPEDGRFLPEPAAAVRAGAARVLRAARPRSRLLADDARLADGVRLRGRQSGRASSAGPRFGARSRPSPVRCSSRSESAWRPSAASGHAALPPPAIVSPAPREVSFGRVKGRVAPGTRRGPRARRRTARGDEGRVTGAGSCSIVPLPQRDVTLARDGCRRAAGAAPRRASGRCSGCRGRPRPDGPIPPLRGYEDAGSRAQGARPRARLPRGLRRSSSRTCEPAPEQPGTRAPAFRPRRR